MNELGGDLILDYPLQGNPPQRVPQRATSEGRHQRFADVWNAKKRPFVLVKTTDQILARTDPQAISALLHWR
ncbi:MAG TPA: hypothetical protein VNH82_09175 [Candidatus Dormibacteraeota bacterium]|nr:hypothetical protein [Candidatus Dormibacteraeota bacterium]